MAGKKLGDALRVDDLIGRNGGGRFAPVPQGEPPKIGDRITSEPDPSSDIQARSGEPVPGRGGEAQAEDHSPDDGE